MLRKLLLKLQNLLSPQKPLQPEKQSSGGLNLLQDSFKDDKNGERTGDTPFGKIDLSDIRVSDGVLKLLKIFTLLPLLCLVVLTGYRIYLDSQLKDLTDKTNLSALEINKIKSIRTEYESVVATQKIYTEISQNKVTLYPKIDTIFKSLVPDLALTNLKLTSKDSAITVESSDSMPFVRFLNKLLDSQLISKVILESASIDNTTKKMQISILVKFK